MARAGGRILDHTVDHEGTTLSDNVAIRVEGLGKQYRIGGPRVPYRTLRDTLASVARNPFRRERERESFWALRDVSFEVRRGEVLGIIGRNGAGKSTLLKILSRITEPTEGRAEIHGRVGSLLEVGTGFHPELTGRENTYLNGAILGMRRQEIDNKFDEIVAFAGVERFVDTPVKHYSSGMYLRLAFAVAAHLEPEILVVDEVLAVGDAAFQKKCVGKMAEVATEGRTVLFVSHNIGAVRRLCGRCLLLSEGRVVVDGATETVLGEYLSEGAGLNSSFQQRANRAKEITLRRVELRDRTGSRRAEYDSAERVTVRIEYDVNTPIERVYIWLGLRAIDDTIVMGTADYDLEPELLETRQAGAYEASVELPDMYLNTGLYYVVVGINQHSPLKVFDRAEAVTFSVATSLQTAIAEADTRPGLLKPALRWVTRRVGDLDPVPELAVVEAE